MFKEYVVVHGQGTLTCAPSVYNVDVLVNNIGMLYVTGFEKTRHLCTSIVSRSISLKHSLSYNSAVVSSRSMAGNTVSFYR